MGDIVEELAGFPITPQTHIVIVTRGHEHDREALRQVVSSPAAYIGMVRRGGQSGLMRFGGDENYV